MFHKLIVLLMIVFVAGCDSTSGPSTTDVLVPLAINNTWVYEISDFDSTGTLYQTSEYIRKLTDTITLEGELYYRINNSIGLAINRSDGHWIAIVNPPGRRYAKYPAFVGEITRRDTLRGSEIDPDPLKITGYSETRLITNVAPVTVPAGTFIAYQYETIHTMANGKPLIKEALYMTPGIGEIKFENYNYLEDGTPWVTSRSELKSYTLH